MKEEPSFEELSRAITGCPMTWLPALLGRMARTCSVKKVFLNRQAFVSFIEKQFDAGGAGLSELRTNREIASTHFAATSGPSEIEGKFLLTEKHRKDAAG